MARVWLDYFLRKRNLAMPVNRLQIQCQTWFDADRGSVQQGDMHQGVRPTSPPGRRKREGP